jgi:Ca2+-binding EF-hand superfamily protein
VKGSSDVASEFQRRKVAGVFEAMDADQDGFLEEEDFEALTERWVGIRGWEPGSVEYDRMRSIMMGWWATLLTMSDQDRDDKVSLDELMLVVDRLGSMDAEVMATADSMFDAIDENGDGLIAVEEHKQVVQAWKGSDAGVEEVFPRLDVNGDGYLSRAEFRELWAEFWRGDDPRSAAQWVFGPI